MLAPGVFFCLDILKLLAPPIVVHVLLRLLSYAYSYDFSPSVFLAVWLFTLPLYTKARSAYTHSRHVRDARRRGADLVPVLKGKWPANIDIFYSNFVKKGIYIGDGITIPTQTLGTTYSLTMLGDTRVFTINPENIKRVLAIDFANYVKGTSFNSTMESMLGSGVFNSDGDMWQFHRRITRPFFAKERVTDFRIFDSKSSLAVWKMQERFDQGLAIDFQDICGRFTLDSASEFLLGASMHSLEDPLPRPGEDVGHLSTASSRFFHAFAKAQTTVSLRGRAGKLWRMREFFKDKTKDDMVIIRGFIEPIVRAAMSKRVGGKPLTNDDGASLLDHLLNVTDDMKIIVDEVINIMLAGRDTTTALLTFVTYCLAMHPQVLVRLREEIISTVGKDRAPSLDDLRSMKYLRAVLNETLRLFSPVPFNVRQTINATTLLSDEGKELYVPPKTRVTMSFINMHRHEAYWGPDAHLWDPDRFIGERFKNTVTTNPFMFLPFNAGPRICLGQQFAYHEASFFVVRMLQRFGSIELAPESQPPASKPPAYWAEATTGSLRKRVEQCVPKSHLTLYADGGLWLKMKASPA